MIQLNERQDEFARRIRELVETEIAPLADCGRYDSIRKVA